MHDGAPLLARGRVAALDGLRALAIAAVIGFHVVPELVPGGWVGVDLFFVLSGYLITQLLDREWQAFGQIDFIAFAGRRSLRVAPALFAMLAVYGLYAWLCTRHPLQHAQGILFAATFSTNWVRAVSSAAEGPLGHTWSLATEQQFYLLWPVALAAIGARRRMVWVGAALAGVICWRAGLAFGGAGVARTYNGFDTHCDGLLLGGLLALVPIRAAVRGFAVRWVALPLGFLTAVLAGMSYKSVPAQAFGIAACVVCCAWLLIAAQQGGRFAAALSILPLRYLGRISYSLYLWHVPILLLGARHVPPGPVGTAILLGATVVMAVVSYHVVEIPFLALRDRLRAIRRVGTISKAVSA